jgi:hypothetical protein
MRLALLKIGAVQSARMWLTSNKPKLTFTRILLDEGFVGPLLLFFNLIEYALYIMSLYSLLMLGLPLHSTRYCRHYSPGAV